MNKLGIFIKTNKELTIILIFIVSSIILVAVQIQNQKKEIEPVKPAEFKVNESTQKQIQWENVKAGETSYEEIKDRFTGFQGRTVNKELIDYTYQDRQKLDEQYRETVISTDKNNIIQFLNLRVNPTKYAEISFYINKYSLGEPDIKMDIMELDNYKAYVYLNKGLMLYVYEEQGVTVITDKMVRNEIYFTPMSKAQFMKLWGNNLTDSFEAGAHDHEGSEEPIE